MNIQEMKKAQLRHLDTKSQFFSKQSLTVVTYVLNRLIKYRGEFFELNTTISDNTGVSVRTIQRTVKRMQELEIISVQSRRKVCPITGKTVQSSNLIKLLPYKTFKVNNEIVVSDVKEVVSSIEVVEEVREETSKEVKPVPSYNRYNKKPIRVEQTPEWLGQEYVKPEETDEIRRQREELIRQLRGA